MPDLQTNRDLAEFLRRQGVKDSTKLRLQDSVLPVSIVTDDSRLTKALHPAAAAVATQPPAVAAQYPGIRILANGFDLVVATFIASGGPYVWIDPPAGPYVAAWTPSATLVKAEYGPPEAGPTHAICTVGSSTLGLANQGLYVPTVGLNGVYWYVASGYSLFMLGQTAGGGGGTMSMQFHEPH